MARRKKNRPVNKNAVIALLELQVGVMAHCRALKAVTELLAQDKKALAVARLDQAVNVLGGIVRGQAVGVTMACPACGSERGVAEWVDEHRCSQCGEPLEIPGEQD